MWRLQPCLQTTVSPYSGLSKCNAAELKKIQNALAELFLDLIEQAMSLLFFKNYTGSLLHMHHILFKYNLIAFKAIKFSQPTYILIILD